MAESEGLIGEQESVGRRLKSLSFLPSASPATVNLWPPATSHTNKPHTSLPLRLSYCCSLNPLGVRQRKVEKYRNGSAGYSASVRSMASSSVSHSLTISVPSGKRLWKVPLESQGFEQMPKGDDGARREMEKDHEMNTQKRISMRLLWKVFTVKCARTGVSESLSVREQGKVEKQHDVQAFHVEKPQQIHWESLFCLWLTLRSTDSWGLWVGINETLITQSNDRVFFLVSCAGKKQVKDITSVWSVWSHFPLLCFEMIATDYIKWAIFHKPALTCFYENIFIKCSLSGSDKEEAITILFWGIRYLALAKKIYEFNMQGLISRL